MPTTAAPTPAAPYTAKGFRQPTNSARTGISSRFLNHQSPAGQMSATPTP